MRIDLWAALAATSLLCCAPPATRSELELRLQPNSIDTVKGISTITAVATDDKGQVGQGTVSFTASVGQLADESATIDEFGKAATTFKCVAGDMPGCSTETSAEITARWTSAAKLVTAQSRIALRQIPPVLPSGDGGVGTDCTTAAECLPGLACVGGICVGSGALRVSLLWTVESDFDIHLKLPAGEEIYYANREAGGGRQDVDMCITPSGCRPQNVENIYFSSTPPPGSYTVWARNYNGHHAGAFTIQVASGTAAPTTYTGTLPATSGADSDRFTFSR